MTDMNLSPGRVSGVAYVDPPPSILESIQKYLDEATKDIAPGTVVAAAVADRRGGWNGVLGARTKNGFQADVWIGKKWGQDERLDFGVRVLKVWKLGGE